MASTKSLLLLICTGFWLIECSYGLEVKLKSNGGTNKYVGDSLILTCTAKNNKTDNPRVKYIWILPINKRKGVQTENTSNGSTLTVSYLREIDGGVYMCQARDVTNNDGIARDSKDSLVILVFPRGRPSHCSGNYHRCNSGHCIPNRYKCDGKADCPRDGSDESPEHCGHNPCAEKLACDDGRCLPHSFCCTEPKHYPNCTIVPSIKCCRQLMHPAQRDPDLYYKKFRSKLEQRRRTEPYSTLVMGIIVAIANLVTVAIIVGVRYHLWRSNSNNFSGVNCHLNRLRSATLRSFGLGSSMPPPSTTDQYQLRSADSLYARRIPGLRADLLAPEILHEQRQNQTGRPYSGVILYPPSNSQPPHYSQLLNPPQGPPPSYHQVVGAPPPPYCSRDDLTANTEGISVSLLAPLIPHQNGNNNNNNNGDVNGNSTHMNVEPNHNIQAAATPSTSMLSSMPQARRNK